MTATTPQSLFELMQSLGFQFSELGLRVHPEAFYDSLESVIANRLEIPVAAFRTPDGTQSIYTFSAFGAGLPLSDNDSIRYFGPAKAQWGNGVLAKLVLDYSISNVADAGKTFLLDIGIHSGPASEDFSSDEADVSISIPVPASLTPDKFATVEIPLDVAYSRGDRLAIKIGRVAGGDMPASNWALILGAVLIHQLTGAPDAIVEPQPDPDDPPPTAPAAPTLNALAAGAEQLTATIASAISGADYYELDISTSSTFASGVTTVSQSGLSKVFTGLSHMSTWYVRARAGNSVTMLESANSATVSAAPNQLSAPGAPTFSEVTAAQIRATFPAVTNAQLYDLRVGTTPTGSEVSFDNQAFVNLVTPTLLVSGLSASTTYYFGCTARGVNPSPESTEASQATSAAPTDIVPSIVSSRISGVAPLGILFDATATTCAGFTKPFHTLDYHWSVNDTAANWTYGNQSAAAVKDKNQGFGPLWAHVFKTAGTYTVTLTIRAPDADITTASVQITVTSGDAGYPGTNTVCISTAGNFSGAPSGASLVTTSSWATIAGHIATANRRVLFAKGETFSATSQVDVATDTRVGAFGSGADPIISCSSAVSIFWIGSVQNVAFYGLDARGPNNPPGFGTANPDNIFSMGEATHVTVVDCNIQGAEDAQIFGYRGYQDNQKLLYTFLHDCAIHDANGYVFFGSFKGHSMQGCTVHSNNTQHLCRYESLQEGVIAHNKFFDNGVNGTHALTIRAPAWNHDNGWENADAWPAGQYTENFVVCDNEFLNTGEGGTTAREPNWSVQITATNSTTDERHRNHIFARNFWYGASVGTPTSKPLSITGEDVTVCSNVFDITNLGNELCVDVDRRGSAQPLPDSVHVLYNTIYKGTNDAGTPRAIRNKGNNCVARGNIVYMPNGGGTIFDIVTAWVTQVDNTGDIAGTTITSDPDFSGTPGGSNPTVYRPDAGSDYENEGEALSTTLRVYRDFTGALRSTTTPDVGAFEIA